MIRAGALRISGSLPNWTQKSQRSVAYEGGAHTVVFQHLAETHVTKDVEILPAYWAWRAKGMSTHNPIRYPVTYNVDIRASSLGEMWRDDQDPQEPWDATVAEALNYISTRKGINVPLYGRYVTAQP
ncbi:hypothetical protein DFJ77DRAFT_476006 [Powellomyces hirtus]|nr:hypothetical protein DFJ77DRAFT_476006 [Powellomyces hirtus]